jgi:hypothetical protein
MLEPFHDHLARRDPLTSLRGSGVSPPVRGGEERIARVFSRDHERPAGEKKPIVCLDYKRTATSHLPL